MRSVVELKPIAVEVCVKALEACGFAVRQRGVGFVVLRRASKVVVVPTVGMLDASMQQAILRSAEIDEREFRRHIAGQSGLFTRMDVKSVASKE